MYLHYIWLGGDKTELVNKCINSFNIYCKKFDIKEWNESNINVEELNSTLRKYYNIWYENKKYAFCSDIIRLYVLQKYKGIYVDTDVEFIKEIPNEMLQDNFVGIESFNKQVGCGLIWNVTNTDTWIDELIDVFTWKLNTSAHTYGKKWIFNSLMRASFKYRGFKYNDSLQYIRGYKIYPSEYFCPKDLLSNKLNITDKTISIHHYDKSWNELIKKGST